MTKEELDIQKEIENYFTESTGFGRDKIKNFMDIVNKALKQKKERITDLEHRLEQTEKDLTDYQFNYPKIKELEEENAVLERRIERAKECMKRLLFIINSDPANYNCKGLIQDAEDFIHNRTCNIRQQGEHCISETRCIMCDKEIEK